MIQIFPSLIGGDILGLRDQIRIFDPYCTGYHLDLMDGHFVPNITWGPVFINAIAAATTKRIWVHMMVTNPRYWATQIRLPMHSMIDFHIEASCDHKQLITDLKEQHNWHVGLAINPSTSITAVMPFLELIDYITIMSVQPGFSGQLFIPESTEKIKELSAIRTEKQYEYSIAIDGGINESIMKKLSADIQYAAIASAIFSSKNNSKTALAKLLDIQKKQKVVI